MIFLFNWVIFRFHVNFPGSIYIYVYIHLLCNIDIYMEDTCRDFPNFAMLD